MAENRLALLQAARRAESTADILQEGPINKTFRFKRRDENYVARKRLPNLSHTNQLFAAERFVLPLLQGSVAMPELVALRLRREKMAIFRYVENVAPDWTASAIQDQLVHALATVHSIEGPGLGAVNRPRHVSNTARYFERMFERECHLFCRTAPLSATEASSLKRERAAFRLFEGRRPTLCHGDVHSLNFLQDPAGRLWTIDWEAARYRFPESDFNQMHVRWLSRECEARILKLYCDLTGHDVERFKKGIRIFRILWHLRTYNFFVEGLKEDPARHASLIQRLLQFLEEAQ